MGGSTKTTQNTTQHQDQSPWAPTIPGLTTGVNQLTDQFANAGVNPTENSAFDTLAANAAKGNPYAPAIGGLATDLLGGGPDYSGRVNDAFGGLSSSLAPTIRGDYLDPSINPFFGNTISGVSDQVRDRINQMFAGSGALGGSANQGTLAKSISEALSPMFASQYDAERGRQMSAINSQFGGANQATGLLSQLSQTGLANRGAGIQAATAAQQANDSGATQQLAVEAARRGLPIQNIQQLLQSLSGVAGLGGTTDMTGQTDSEQKVPLLQQLIGGAIGGAGLLGGANKALGSGWMTNAMSGLGGTGAAAAGGLDLGTGVLAGGSEAAAMAPEIASAFLMLSDERTKENKVPVGELADGQTVWSYNYLDDPTPRIGLMAQEVERTHPEAVVTGPGGIKMVNYARATSTARGLLGHLKKVA